MQNRSAVSLCGQPDDYGKLLFTLSSNPLSYSYISVVTIEQLMGHIYTNIEFYFTPC